MRRTYYVVDKDADEIVNACDSDGTAEETQARFTDIWPASRYKFDPDPPQELLDRYRYYNERP